MSGLERPPAQVRDRLLKAAARESGTPPGTWRHRLVLVALLATTWLAGALFALGLRRDWNELPVGALAITLTTLIAVAALASGLGLARGRAMVGAGTAPLSMAAWGLLVVLHIVVVVVAPRGPSTQVFSGFAEVVGHARGCFVLTIGFAAPLIAVGMLLPRGLTLARPALAGACWGLGAATWVHAVVWLHCPIGGSGHALLGHLLPAIPAMALGAWGMWMLGRGRPRT